MRAEVLRLERSLRAAYEQAWPKREIVALLRALLGCESDPERQASLSVELAEALLGTARPTDRQVWQAASLVRKVTAGNVPSSLRARAHAVQGLAQTCLGNYRAARVNYERAHRLDATDVSVAHNLGHLLAHVFRDGARALPLLRAAWEQLPAEQELAASYAHALQRFGNSQRAREVLVASGMTLKESDGWLRKWASLLEPDAGSVVRKKSGLGAFDS